jgi:type I restriction enzyme S subunit
MSVRAPVGPVNFATDEVCIGRGLAAIRSSAALNRDFLFYQLWHLQPEIAGREGAVFASINKAEIEALPLAVAPLAEQQRIVGLLDKAFEGLATAKANAEKNLQNARALFESHLQSVFTQRGPGWVEKPLGDFCSFENGDRGTNYPSKSARTATGIPFINAGHLTDDGIDLETMDYIPRERFDLLSNGKIRKGDILFCLRGSLGKFAKVGGLPEGAIASSLVIVRPDKTVLNDFLVAYFRSPLCTAMIHRFKNGAAQPNLSAQSLRNFSAPIPPLEKQESVVEQLTDLREHTRRLAAIYARKLTALEAVKKSLLHQAFTGAL